MTSGTLPSGYTSYIRGIAGIAIDPGGELFVSNPSASQVLEFTYSHDNKAYSATGTFVAGQGGTGDGLSQLYEPAQLAVNSVDDVYVVDAGNNRVMEYTAANGAPAYTDNGTQIFAGASLISYPDNAGIALDPQGDVLLGSDYPDGAVYEVPASSGTSPTTTSTASTSSSSTSTSTTSPTSTSTTTTTVPPGPFPGWTVVTPPDGFSAGTARR